MNYLKLLFLIYSFTLTAEISIQTNIDFAHENIPIRGTISIFSSGKVANQKIEPSSFKIGLEKLLVSKKKRGTLNQGSWIDIFNFSLPAKPAGEHELPKISVKIGDKIYSSASQNFTVQKSQDDLATPASLNLKALVDGPVSIHPGQQTILVYQISFRGNIDLTKSTLPFIHTDKLKRIGDPVITDFQEGETSHQKISQLVEATSIGTFFLGPSSIEGYSYDYSLGEKKYHAQLLKSVAPKIKIEVLPFKSAKKPKSFNGAIGKILSQAKLLSSHEVTLGQSMTLEIIISGVSNIAEFELLDLNCQPGFSGNFSFDPLSIKTKTAKNQKTYIFDIKPLNSLAYEIPAFHFSSFDVATNKYEQSVTDSIAIKVNQSVPDSPITIFFEASLANSQKNSQLVGQKVNQQHLNQASLYFWQTPKALFINLIFLGLILCYSYLLRYRELYPSITSNSAKFMQLAKNNINSPDLFLHYLKKALIAHLKENMGYNLNYLTINNLKEDYVLLLTEIESRQFSQTQEFTQPAAQKIYAHLSRLISVKSSTHRHNLP